MPGLFALSFGYGWRPVRACDAKLAFKARHFHESFVPAALKCSSNGTILGGSVLGHCHGAGGITKAAGQKDRPLNDDYPATAPPDTDRYCQEAGGARREEVRSISGDDRGSGGCVPIEQVVEANRPALEVDITHIKQPREATA